jgi:hypothetical protein
MRRRARRPSRVDPADPDLEPVPVVGVGRELGTDDEQLPLDREHGVVEVTGQLGPGQPERAAGLVDRAVGGGADVVLVDPPAVEQPVVPSSPVLV